MNQGNLLQKQKKIYELLEHHKSECMTLSGWIDTLNRSLPLRVRINNSKELSWLFAILKSNGAKIEKTREFFNNGNLHYAFIKYSYGGVERGVQGEQLSKAIS